MVKGRSREEKEKKRRTEWRKWKTVRRGESEERMGGTEKERERTEDKERERRV